MVEEVTVETLAKELSTQRKELRRISLIAAKHYKDCNELRKITADAAQETTRTVTLLAGRFTSLEEQFLPWARLSGFISRRGKWLSGIVTVALVSALSSILIQNYYLHEQTAKAAVNAADAAQKVAVKTAAIAKAVGAQ